MFSIQNLSIQNAVQYGAKAFQVDPQNDRYIVIAAKLTAGAVVNSVIAVAALLKSIALGILYTISFLPLYASSKHKAIESLADRVTADKLAAKQAAGQIAGVWVKQGPIFGSKMQIREIVNSFKDSILVRSDKAAGAIQSGLQNAKAAAWNHKGKIALGVGIIAAIGTEHYFNYPHISAIKNK